MTNIIRSTSVLVIVCSFVVGCGSTASMHMLNEDLQVYTATTPTQIKVYVARDIGRDYVELGSVSTSINGELDGKKYIRKIKEEAAKIGADAIVAYQQYGTSASGIAIKYKP